MKKGFLLSLVIIMMLLIVGCNKEYTITFDADGGSFDVTTIKVRGKGKKIDEPVLPVKEGYQFDGWYTSKDFNSSSKYDFNQKVKSSFTLYAKWIKFTYSINYILDGGILPSDAIYYFNNYTEVELPVPKKEGYTFLGWYEDDVLVKSITNKDYNLVAKWKIEKYYISYNLDGGHFTDEFISSFEYGDKIELSIPTKEGYTFLGWYENDKLVEEITYSDHYLIAKWKINKYTITFDVDGGQPLDPVEVEYGQTIGNITPTKEHATFLGWLLDGTSYDINTKVTSNITLKASWLDDYIITVHFNNGLSDLILYAKPGQTILDLGGLDDAKKPGYKFMGYFLDIDCTIQLGYFKKIYSDIDIYAKFSYIYKITYHLNGGTSIEPLLDSYVEEDIELTKYLVSPNRVGYFFRGWYESEDFSSKMIYKLEKGDARDITLYAKWIEATLENSYLTIVGDSISTYKGYLPSGFVHYPYYADPSTDSSGKLKVEQMWWKIVQENLKCKLSNINSYSGTCVMSEYGGWTSTEGLTRLKYSQRTDQIDPDIMIVFMGNNDAMINGLNISKFEKSYQKMIDNIYSLFPNITLFICTVSYEEYCYKNGLYDNHLIVTPAVNRIIKELGSKYNIPVIDFASAYNDSSYLFDSVHPNALGMKALANVATSTIKEYYKNKENII